MTCDLAGFLPSSPPASRGPRIAKQTHGALIDPLSLNPRTDRACGLPAAPSMEIKSQLTVGDCATGNRLWHSAIPNTDLLVTLRI